MTEPDSERRRFLSAVGTGGIVLIAGCSGGGGSESTPTVSPTPTPSPTPTTPNEQALEPYQEAIHALIENKEQLDQWADNGFDGDAQALSDLRDRLSQARDDLDSAEDNADPTGDLVAKIDQARLVANFQELNIAFYDITRTFLQLVDDARSFAESEQPQRAADKWAEAVQAVDDTRSVVDDMETIFEQMDTEILDEPDLEYPGEALDYIEIGDRRVLDSAEDYAAGHESLQRSFVRFEVGFDHYENEEYAEAREEWEAGRSQLEEALTSFEAVVDNDHAPDEFHQDSITQIGVAESMLEAFDKFVEGAKESEAGNVEKGDNLVKEGLDILGDIFG